MTRWLGFLVLIVLAIVSGALFSTLANGPEDEGAPTFDLGSFTDELTTAPAPVARNRFAGASCPELASELGTRLDRDFRGLVATPGFDPTGVWRRQVEQLNALFGRLTELALDCEASSLAAGVDVELSAEFRAQAFRYVPAEGEPRPARDHAEWRTMLMTALEAFAELRED